jgi:hypothetical protein
MLVGENMTKPKGRRTIRQLGGEIWLELRARQSERETDWRAENRIIAVAMGVLARHTGAVIENDPDHPVAPLPPKDPKTD